MCVIAIDSRLALHGYIGRDGNDSRILFPAILMNEWVYMDRGLIISFAEPASVRSTRTHVCADFGGEAR
jgi:hypothetical protein